MSQDPAGAWYPAADVDPLLDELAALRAAPKGLTDLEAKARAMLDACNKQDAASADNWVHRQAVRTVFRAMWGSALPRHSVQKIAAAMLNFANPPDLSAALSALVREGLLRSRMHGGERVYEINFPE